MSDYRGEVRLSFALVAILCVALFAVIAPTYGFWGAIAGIGACFLGAALGGGPFLLYIIWRDRHGNH